MKKTMFLLVVVCLFAHLEILAQGYSGANNIRINDVLSTNGTGGVISLGPDVEGSPYLNEEWQKAVVETTNDETIETTARYRYYDNTVEIKKEDDEKIYALGKNFTKSITIGNKHFVTLNYQDEKGNLKSGFFELLAEGQLYFLIQYEKMVIDAVNDGYRSSPMRIKAKRNFLAYNQSNKKMVALTRLNKKSISPLFGSDSKKVEDYAKKKKLSFKKSADLTKIFEYYNSISAE